MAGVTIESILFASVYADIEYFSGKQKVGDVCTVTFAPVR